MWSQAQAQAHVQAQAQAQAQACALAHAQDQIDSGRDRDSAQRQRQWGADRHMHRHRCNHGANWPGGCAIPRPCALRFGGTLGGCPVPAPACCRAGASVCNAPAASEIDAGPPVEPRLVPHVAIPATRSRVQHILCRGLKPPGGSGMNFSEHSGAPAWGGGHTQGAHPCLRTYVSALVICWRK